MNLKYFILFIYLASSVYTAPERAEDHFYHVDMNTRIVGGSEAAEGSVPYMVAMISGVFIRSFVCGGSLVSNRHVLTAAHCIDTVYGLDALYSSLRISVGTNQWNYGGRTYIVVGNITHENWDIDIVKNDIGLLIVNTDISLTDRIQLVPLNYDYVGDGITARVTGWGRVVAGGCLSSRLLELIVQTVEEKICSEALDNHLDPVEQGIVYDPKVELCTFHSHNKGVCNGDSGSALVRMDIQEQIGIVSWGYECASGVPDIFVRLSSYKEWLENALLR